MVKKNKVVEKKDTAIDKNLKTYAPVVLGIGGFIIVVVVLLYFVSQGVGKVEYNGLTFIKERYGEVVIYHYSYLTSMDNGNARRVDLLLRGDPSENNVPVEGEIVYPLGKPVYLSINSSGLDECKYSTIALAGFSGFIASNDIVLKAGTPDKEQSQKNNSTYVTCENYPSNMVVSLKSGSESKIERTSPYCYELEVANCEILPVMEKFIVQSVLDAKG